MVKKSDIKKIKSNKKAKSKSMKKRFVLIISVIAIIGIIGFVWFTLSPDVAKAQLIIESGTVQIKHEGGSWTSAQNGTLLYQSDTVKTGNNTFASIVLFKSSIIRLDSNTEVMLQEILQQAGETSVKIKQDVGRTWNTISKMSGIDNYEVQTPTAVASVRGTSLDVNVHANGTTVISVIKGIVNVSITENGSIVYTIEINENWSVTVDFDEMGQPEPFDLDDWILNNLLKDEKFKKDLKEILYERIEPYIPELKDLYNATDEEIDILIDGYIEGDFPIPPDTPDWIRELFDLS